MNVTKFTHLTYCLYVFQQDSVPVHRARETVDLSTKETPGFIPPTLNNTVWSSTVISELRFKNQGQHYYTVLSNP